MLSTLNYNFSNDNKMYLTKGPPRLKITRNSKLKLNRGVLSAISVYKNREKNIKREISSP